MLFFWLGDFFMFCTITALLLYYNTTVPYQASDVVDCGGECRLDAKVFNMIILE